MLTIEFSNMELVVRLNGLLSGILVNKEIAVWGVSFKAGTGDLRDSPALDVVKLLLNEGAELAVFDPYVKDAMVLEALYQPTALSAVMGADALVVLSEWPEFQNVDPKLVHNSMRSSIVYDSRGVLPINEWENCVDLIEVVGEAPKKQIQSPG